MLLQLDPLPLDTPHLRAYLPPSHFSAFGTTSHANPGSPSSCTRELRAVGHDDAHDDACGEKRGVSEPGGGSTHGGGSLLLLLLRTKDAQSGAKDLYDEDFDEEGRVLRVSQGAAGARDAHADAAA